MNFKYFKNDKAEVFAYDIDDETQLPYMQSKIDEGCIDITDSWTPPPVTIIESKKPTVEELQAQLIDIQNQLASLS